MTAWQYIRLEYQLARRRNGRVKSLLLAFKAHKAADTTIPF
jgi:hypothetical protein